MLIHEKIEQAKKILTELEVDCWITFVRESQINGDPVLPFLVAADVTWHSAFIVTSGGEAHAIVGEYDKQTVEEIGAYDSVQGFVEGIKGPFLEIMRKLGPARIAVNYSEGSEICDGLTHGMYLTLHGMLAEIGFEGRLMPAEEIVSALRERKSPTEIASIREAIRVTEAIFEQVRAFIHPGRTEQEIAEFMKGEVARRGVELAWEPALCPAVFTGPGGAGAHYAPTNRAVERGHVLNMDFGVRIEGYCSDMQRTFYIMDEGEKAAPGDVQNGFDTIVAAIAAACASMRPGVEARHVDAAARETVTNAGYEEFPHGLGHQVGRFSHDGTALLGPAWEKYARKPFRKLEENMVFTLEPRLTVPDRGVVTIEEMVVVTSSGAKFLSSPQEELWLI